MFSLYVIDVNTFNTPEEDAHSPSRPNGLVIIIIIIIIIHTQQQSLLG
jgi:hypothetical protein